MVYSRFLTAFQTKHIIIKSSALFPLLFEGVLVRSFSVGGIIIFFVEELSYIGGGGWQFIPAPSL
jgi:hypothetical protein